MKRYWRIVLAASLLALVLMTVLYQARATLLPQAMRWLDVGTTPERTHAAFILLGDSDSRPFVAAALYNAGLVDEVLLAQPKPQEVDPNERQNDLVNQHILMSRGVPERRIRFLGNGITNTMNETQTLRQYMEDNPGVKVSVVTSHFHTRRTRWSMQQNLGQHAARLRYVSSPHREFDASDWWSQKRGFELILMEYIKLLGYWVVYGTAVYWCLGILALGALAVLGMQRYRRRVALA